MAYNRGYGRERVRARSRERDYGWGVPVHGMYDYSLDYGNMGGPETDSESIPGYDTRPDDWTGPRPQYERHHWAAGEPGGESRFRALTRGLRRHARELGPFRSAYEAARARALAGYGADYAEAYEEAAGRWRRLAGRRGPHGGEAAPRPRRVWPEYARAYWRGRGGTFGPGRRFGAVAWGGGWAPERPGRSEWEEPRGYDAEYRGRDDLHRRQSWGASRGRARRPGWAGWEER